MLSLKIEIFEKHKVESIVIKCTHKLTVGKLQWKLATATWKKNYFPMLTGLRFCSRNRALYSPGSNKAEKKAQRQQLSVNGIRAARFSPLFSAFFKAFPH